MKQKSDSLSCNTTIFTSANGSRIKHCLVPKCNNAKVAGNNWTRHCNKKHTEKENKAFKNTLMF